MQRSNTYLAKRDEKLLIALEVYSELRLSDFEDNFEVSECTLRRDLDALEDGGYVEVRTGEEIAGAVNRAHLYSLSEDGRQYLDTISIDEDNPSVQARIRELERENAQLRSKHTKLKESMQEWTKAVEHYHQQFIKIAAEEGYEIEPWIPKD